MLATKKGYHPVYDIENESPNSWKRFIPNDNFYEVLTTALNSIEPSSGIEKKRSIWIHGTYGTGKSHATSVIKHLLWDDIGDIADFVEGFEDQYQYQYRVTAFRDKNRVFPVVIKGASNIIDNRSFSAAIQRAVTDSCKSHGIWDDISTKNDFENMIAHIEKTQEYTDWNKFIGDHKELKIHAKDTKNLLRKLEDGNVTVLKELEKLLNESGSNVVVQNIADWLKEIVKELKEKNIANYLMIFWDEFTSILELERKDMSSTGISSSEWQNIAELSRDKNVYLFIVSHRFPRHYDEEDQKKTLDRFNSVNYVMQPLTTYHIMENAIKKIDKDSWGDLKEKYVTSNPDLVDLIKKLVGNEGPKMINTVIDLFPIHPYTAYLATFISRYVGSAQRSVFKFLTDNEMGFLSFIEVNPNGDSNVFLTPDQLWDFFLDEFESLDVNMVAPILERYRNNRKKVEEAGKEHLAVFKAILLLNTLNYQLKVREYDSGYVQPSENNLKSMFIGTEYADSVGNVLEFLNQNDIILKNPYGIYEITASTLDSKKVGEEIRKLRTRFDLLKVLSVDHKNELKRIFDYGSLRHAEVTLYNANQPEHLLNSKLHRELKEVRYELRIAVFIAKDQADITNAESILKKFSKEYFNDIIFVLVQEPFKNVDFERYLQYKARANVAATLDDFEQEKANEDNAEKILSTWIDIVKKQYALYFFRGESKRILAHELPDQINKKLSCEIYSSGLENTPVRGFDTIWKVQKSKTAIETILKAQTRDDFNNVKSAQFKPLQEMFKDSNSDWIIDNKLRIKRDADNSHPIVRAQGVVDGAIKQTTQHNFHLGKVLAELSKPPYGYYTNPVHFGALAFLLRPYVGSLYSSGTGTPIDNFIMSDEIQAIFDYWKDGRERENILRVRFGTTEEKELIEKLKEIFKLDEAIKSLNDVRWGIRDKIKEWGYPLWVYKEFTDSDEVKKTIDSINSLIVTVDKAIDNEIIEHLLREIEAIEFDLPEVFSSQKDGKAGFIKWLRKIEDLGDSDIEDDSSFNDLKGFIKQNLQEEIPFWKEEVVKNQVLSWKLKKGRMNIREGGPPFPTRDEGPLGGYGNPESATPPEEMTTEQVKTVQKTLDDFQGDLKGAIAKAIEEHPFIWDILKKYLKSENI